MDISHNVVINLEFLFKGGKTIIYKRGWSGKD